MITYSGITKSGSRPVNEDSIKVCGRDNNFGCIVCDGLGGHGMGDVASQHVVSCFEQCLNCATHVDSDFLREMFDYSQDSLMQEQIRRNSQDKMKTTAVCFVCDGTEVCIGHVGDSRLYVFQDNKVLVRTLDHSLPQMLALSGEISDSQIRNHPDRNKLLKAMGTKWEKPMYTLLKPISLNDCQAILLCSDGFWELIDESAMCHLLQNSTDVRDWLSRMVCVVENNGKGKNMDNYSAIAVLNVY